MMEKLWVHQIVKKKPSESLSILLGTYNNFKKKYAKIKIKSDSPEI